MEFARKSWVVRKKKTKKPSFDILPNEIQTNIFRRLSKRTLSKAMCVSHSWRYIILYTTLSNKPRPNVLTGRRYPDPFLDLERIFLWCSKVMCYSVSPQNLIDTCNGLLLFCHKHGQAENLTHGVYHYYVVNHVTKQCVAILKPTGIISGGYSYAALAYDPNESWFFKLMRFQGCRHVSVFSSETGRWKTLTIDLPRDVHETHWVRKSVYKKGAIYRLAWSGHLIKFMVDPQETIEEQAVALTLPPACLLDYCHWDIGVRRDKILFSMSLGAYFFRFKLLECIERGVLTHKWEKIHSINNLGLRDLNFHGELLSFHPYQKVAFFMRGSLLFVLFTARKNAYPRVVEFDQMVHDYIRKCGLPLLECSTSFACSLEKEHPRDFQRLAIPDEQY